MKWFKSLPRLIQMILLLIPVVNWIVEIVVRWDTFLHTKSIINLIMALVATFFFGNILGWVDFFWCLFFHNLFLN